MVRYALLHVSADRPHKNGNLEEKNHNKTSMQDSDNDSDNNNNNNVLSCILSAHYVMQD